VGVDLLDLPVHGLGRIGGKPLGGFEHAEDELTFVIAKVADRDRQRRLRLLSRRGGCRRAAARHARPASDQTEKSEYWPSRRHHLCHHPGNRITHLPVDKFPVSGEPAASAVTIMPLSWRAQLQGQADVSSAGRFRISLKSEPVVAQLSKTAPRGCGL